MSLIARYKLDGNARDSEGSAHGTAIDVTWAPSQLVDGGGEARLNGTTSRIETAIQFTTETAASLPIWFRPREGAGHLIGQHDGTNGLAIEQTVTGKIRLVVGATASAEVTVYPGEYHHAVPVYDNGEATLYLDNEAVASVTATVTWPAVPVTIGSRAGGSEALACDVVDVRGYHQALAALEVEQLSISINLNALDPNYQNFTTGLTGWYSMLSIEGSTLEDDYSDKDGVIYGAQSISGPTGAALFFDGSNDRVNFPGVLPAGNSARSVSFWFYYDMSDYRCLFNTGRNQVNEAFGIQVNRPSYGCIWFEGWGHDLNTAPILSAGNWYHLSLVYDGTTTGGLGSSGIGNGLTLYVNGQAVPWQSYGFGGDTPLSTVLSDVSLGARKYSGLNADNFLRGGIGGLQFHQRKLIPEEVQYLHEKKPTFPLTSVFPHSVFGNIALKVGFDSGYNPHPTPVPNPTAIPRSGRSGVQGVSALLASPAWFDQRDGSGGSHLSPAGTVSRPDRQGRLSGNTTDQNGQPVSRRVRCFERRTGRIVRETWSNAAGYYQFDDLDPGKRFTVVAHDYTGTYNAVIADNAQPEVPA